MRYGTFVEKDGEKVFQCDEKNREVLLPILQEIQKEHGYIPDKDMQHVADQLGIHPVEVYAVVTFYSFLTEKKKGTYCIRVSNCLPNQLAGSAEVVTAFEKMLKIKVGETTDDRKFTLEMTGCIGMCDQAPAIMVNEKLIGNVTPGMINEILGAYN